MRKILLIVLAVSFLFACQKGNLERSVEVYNTGEKTSNSNDDSGGGDGNDNNGNENVDDNSGEEITYIRYLSSCESGLSNRINMLKGVNNLDNDLNYTFDVSGDDFIRLKNEATRSYFIISFYNEIPTESCVLYSAGSNSPESSIYYKLVLKEYYSYYYSPRYYSLRSFEQIYFNILESEVEITFCNAGFMTLTSNEGNYIRSAKFKFNKSLLK